LPPSFTAFQLAPPISSREKEEEKKDTEGGGEGKKITHTGASQMYSTSRPFPELLSPHPTLATSIEGEEGLIAEGKKKKKKKKKGMPGHATEEQPSSPRKKSVNTRIHLRPFRPPPTSTTSSAID